MHKSIQTALRPSQARAAALELKPCPFCGRHPRGDAYNGSEHVDCDNRDCAAFAIMATREQWNRRRASREQSLSAALREYLDADKAFGSTPQEPSYAWRAAEARLRQARIDARATLDASEG
jgi:hypothetical protein